MHIPRPPNLYRLFATISSLPGVGPKMAEIMKKKMGEHIIDILRHLPISINDRSSRPTIDEALDGQLATFEILVLSADIPSAKIRRPSRIIAQTNGGKIELVFFHAQSNYLRQTLPIGARRIISGRVDRFKGRLQMAHPDYILELDKIAEMPELEPVYPLTAGLRAKPLRQAIISGLKMLPSALPEWIEAKLLSARGWPDFNAAMIAAHHPKNIAALYSQSAVRTRLAFDELFANQLALGLLRKQTQQSVQGVKITGTNELTSKLLGSLPFTPTKAQIRVIAQIKADQNADSRMLRLLQGDVGSGKTLVALMAMLTALEAGYQSALLAPTEILARQHHQNLTKLLAPMNIHPELLVGGSKTKKRADILARLSNGDIKVIIGTHALLSDEVQFSALGLAVVDEQHRFGVRQRLILGQKGGGCDVLVMTATPIPRSLSMTAYGDLSISKLDEKPQGRQEIETAIINLDKLPQIIDRLRLALDNGQQAYWICPLIEETDKLDIAAAEDRYKILQKLLPSASIGLVHGRMKTDDREQAMAAFKSGDNQILVATTVIEVGVDVPEASIIIIEHAERFGLAQLHQLRGRVGRGARKSSCILTYQNPLGVTARARLKIMRQTNDGFIIAEEDLRLRGPGEVLGQRQSGLPEFTLADLAEHADLLALARKQAALVLAQGIPLTDPSMARYIALLSLFERDSAVKFLDSG